MLPGVRLVVDPATAGLALAFVLGGVALGTVSGLVPGLHVNSMALVLAALAPSIPGPPRLVGAAILAAGVTHTFLDVVPALALGVPDPAMAATALPGHRLVIEGRGREALRLSALGSGLAVLLAIPLAVPMTAVMVTAYPAIRANLPVVLAGVVAFLVASERSRLAVVGALVAFGASVAVGLAFLDRTPAGPLPTGDMLAPLFAGLFGAPLLLDAIGGEGVPPQTRPTVAMSRRDVGVTAATGALAGAVVGFLPGISSAIAAVVALTVVPGRTGARGFLVATSGVNTANAVFALFALVALGSPRTGVLVALERARVPVALPLLLASVALASAVGFLLVPTVGDRYLRRVGDADYARLSVAVLALLAVLSVLLAGPAGLLGFVVAAAVGLIPPRCGARRVHLMGVLIGPIVVGS